ncbi:CBS domain-containing protein CBSX5 [Quillaja saponaria]|uniref:CBS domain-containing protein CBSX5 n=1 Tax=Quillaja saponaria TaxID=32244 RepID=A0AAD7M227_QUISA|nr:CBS domain-containing protein CBSX5 [Quillaja saponaria]
MAVRLFAHEVSDLCIGKPALRSLSVSDTVGDALSALKKLGEIYLSVWSCDHSSNPAAIKSEINVKGFAEEDCRCVGKVCMVDVICYLCKEENLASPAVALQSPISVLIPKASGLVRHLEPHASLLEAIDLILEGASHLVVPIEARSTRNSRIKLLEQKPSFDSTLHNNREYCWLTQEDIIRYLINSIGLFSPTPINPINSLNVVDTNRFLALHYDDPAYSALSLISEALIHQTSVAIVDLDGKLIGEISPFTLNSCDEAASAAIATLSAGDLMAYIDCGGPPEELVQLVKERLEERNLGAAMELMEEESVLSTWSSFCSTSSEEEFSSTKNGKLGGYSARLVRRSEAIVCYPWSSLVAVMIQALAHRVSYVWVVEEDGTLTGVVTFTGMLNVFREQLKSM